MTFKLPAADDTNVMPYIGHNFMKVHHDYAGDAAWEHNRDFRTIEWNDIGLEGGDGKLWDAPDFTYDDGSTSRSVLSRITELNEAQQADGPKLSPQEANEQFGLNGMLTFDNEVTKREAEVLYERKLREMKFQLVASQATNWGKWHMFGHGLGSALWDPVNIGITFIPFFGQAGQFLNAMHKGYMGFRALNTLNRVRLAQGFVHTAAWTTAFEIPAAYAKHQEKAQYTLKDSFFNIAAGGTFGAFARAGVPKVWGWFTNVPHKRHEAALKVAAAQFVEGKDVDVHAIIRAARNLAKGNADGRILTDIDAASLQRSYNKETGYVPPMLSAPTRLLENEGPTMGDLNARMNRPPNWVMADMPLRTQDFDITSTKLGSNDGGMMVHKQTGETWYLKTPKNQEWAANEWIASAIIERLIGQRGSRVRLVYKDGKPHGIASRWKKGEKLTPKFLKTMKKRFPSKLRSLRETAMVHAWLGNRDWAAPENLIVDRGGNVHSIDPGGSLNFRSKGERKTDFNKLVLTEMLTFLDGTNPAIKAIMDDMTPTDFFHAIRKIFELSNKEITEIVEGMMGHPGMKKPQVEEMIATLIARRDKLASMGNWVREISDHLNKTQPFDFSKEARLAAKKFPKALQKVWFDQDVQAGKIKASSGYNKLLNLSEIANSYNHTRKEIFPIRYSVKAIENWLDRKVREVQNKLTKGEIDALRFWQEGVGLLKLHDFVASVNAGKYLPSKNLKADTTKGKVTTLKFGDVTYTLENLPKILEDVNKLTKTLDEKKKAYLKEIARTEELKIKHKKTKADIFTAKPLWIEIQRLENQLLQLEEFTFPGNLAKRAIELREKIKSELRQPTQSAKDAAKFKKDMDFLIKKETGPLSKTEFGKFKIKQWREELEQVREALKNFKSKVTPTLEPTSFNKMAKIYDDLLSAINKLELDEQITIFTGKTVDNFKMLNTAMRTIKNGNDLSQIIGKQIKSDSFLNGSLNRATGDVFVDQKTGGTNISSAIKTLKDTSLPVFLEVRVPEGTKLALANAHDLTPPREMIPTVASITEFEVILAPGTPLHIVDARIHNTQRTGVDGKPFKARTVYIKAEVLKDGTPISREAQLSNAHWNQYRNHSLATADVQIPKEMIGLNKREEILKVEADPNNQKFKQMTKQVQEITEDYKILNEKNVNDQITKINNEFSDTNKFNTLVGKAMKAIKNCITGKV